MQRGCSEYLAYKHVQKRVYFRFIWPNLACLVAPWTPTDDSIAVNPDIQGRGNKAEGYLSPWLRLA